MKKNYIKPTACVSMTQTHVYLHTASPFTVRNAAVDGSYSGRYSTDTKVDNSSMSFSQDANERGNFGSDSPWESIW